MGFQSSENILLLGAGFTKNFGGLLADEMWAEIFNHKEIQRNPRIKTLMLNDFDYESVFYSVLEGFRDEEGVLGTKKESIVFTDEEKNAMMEATTSAYMYIDEILREHIKNNPYPTEFDFFNDFIAFIGSQHIVNTGATSFIFTLNQDLLFERISINHSDSNLSIPGIDNNPKWFTTYFNEAVDKLDYCKLPTENELRGKNILSEGRFFLIKLHGSCNWISFDGSEMMVIGRGKKEKIQKEPLLETYFEIFEAAISKPQRRLFIFGYGFGDIHINEIISKAVTNHELKIYVLSPESPAKLKKKLCGRDDTINMWKAVSGYYQSVEEILIRKDFVKEAAKEHFHNTFFS